MVGMHAYLTSLIAAGGIGWLAASAFKSGALPRSDIFLWSLYPNLHNARMTDRGCAC